MSIGKFKKMTSIFCPEAGVVSSEISRKVTKRTAAAKITQGR